MRGGKRRRSREHVCAGSNQSIQPCWHRNFNLLDILCRLSSTFIKERLVYSFLAFFTPGLVQPGKFKDTGKSLGRSRSVESVTTSPGFKSAPAFLLTSSLESQKNDWRQRLLIWTKSQAYRFQIGHFLLERGQQPALPPWKTGPHLFYVFLLPIRPPVLLP